MSPRIMSVLFCSFAVVLLPYGSGSDSVAVRAQDKQDAEVVARRIGKALQGEGQIETVVFSPDSKLLLAGFRTGFDYRRGGKAKLWNARTGELVHVLEHGWFEKRNLGGVVAAGFSADGKLIVTGTEQGHPFAAGYHLGHHVVFETATGKRIGNPVFSSAHIDFVAFSPDQKLVLVCQTDWKGMGNEKVLEAHATLRPVAGGDKLAGKAMFHNRSILAAAFSADGKRLVTGDSKGIIRTWQVPEGKLEAKFGLEMKQDGDLVIKFSPDIKRVVIAGHLLQQWDVATGKPVGDAIIGGARAITYTPDGKTVLIGTGAKIRRYEAATWKRVGPSIRLPVDKERDDAMAFSPDGKTVVTTVFPKRGEKGSAQLWELPD